MTMHSTKLRRDDKVVVIAGRDKGSQGQVLKVISEKSRVVVSKVNMIKRHMRATPQGKGGILEKEAPIVWSNVQFYCPRCKKGVRLGYKILEDGKKVRYCRKCQEVVDS